MENEKTGFAKAWATLGEKTRWMNSEGGQKITMILAVILVGWSLYSAFVPSDEGKAAPSAPAQNYTLSE
ncbi:hypothetical protein [Enterovibrio paralichthyis]|uniref:hypothetical protein n=1 Tax=Enterovibrio paralichthyis TaxID=2853805 RepID=UPI001C48B2D2|nr:hypothetical protein [Enterovibrio paralichthyis]MBV7300273.1 hypothetical protein [Enterovibrio paralichthyis]